MKAVTLWRDASMSFHLRGLLLFPYESFKPGQHEAFLALLRHSRLMLQGPTGLGKTLIVLVALLPEVLCKQKRMVVLTRTKTQVFSVLMKECIKLIQSNKEILQSLKVVPLIGREDLCGNECKNKYDVVGGGTCVSNSWCPLKEYTMSLSAAEVKRIIFGYIREFSEDKLSLTLSVFRKMLVNKYSVCPYYFVLRALLLKEVDLILGTHGYIQTYKGQEFFSRLVVHHEFEKTIVVLDEAHNFGPQVEAELSVKVLQSLKDMYKLDIIQQLYAELLSYEESGKIDRPPVTSTGLKLLLKSYKRIRMSPLQDTVRLLKAVLSFWEAKGDYWWYEKEEELLLQINPFPDLIFRYLEQFYKVILLSGTFIPAPYYQRLYGTEHYETHTIQIKRDNLFMGILKNKSYGSMEALRTPPYLEKMVALIYRLHSLNWYHTLIFAPSYDYCDLLMKYGLKTPYVERQNISSPSWLSELSQVNHALILGVIGGKLSEGIEILHPITKRSLLTLILICGLPFPASSELQTFLLEKYAQKFGKRLGKQLLIYVPILRKIQQAIGRGIRHPDDITAAVILDYRARHALFHCFMVKFSDDQRHLLTTYRPFILQI